MDAIALLKNDHKTVAGLLAKGESTTERAVKTRQEVLAKIKHELEVHVQIEEEIFYPMMKEFDKTRPKMFEAHEEHEMVEDMIAKLEQDDPSSESWTGKFAVLKEMIEHHVEEEEGEIFPKTRKLVAKADLEEIGAQMEARKMELKQNMK